MQRALHRPKSQNERIARFFYSSRYCDRPARRVAESAKNGMAAARLFVRCLPEDVWNGLGTTRSVSIGTCHVDDHYCLWL